LFFWLTICVTPVAPAPAQVLYGKFISSVEILGALDAEEQTHILDLLKVRHGV
jgi:hypothetical protein